MFASSNNDLTATKAARSSTHGDDLCDRCGAHAYMAAVLPNGALHFCAHHGRSYRARLVAAGARIIDNSHQLHPQAA